MAVGANAASLWENNLSRVRVGQRRAPQRTRERGHVLCVPEDFCSIVARETRETREIQARPPRPRCCRSWRSSCAPSSCPRSPLAPRTRTRSRSRAAPISEGKWRICASRFFLREWWWCLLRVMMEECSGKERKGHALECVGKLSRVCPIRTLYGSDDLRRERRTL